MKSRQEELAEWLEGHPLPPDVVEAMRVFEMGNDEYCRALAAIYGGRTRTSNHTVLQEE